MAAWQAVRAQAQLRHKKEAARNSFDARCPLRMAMCDEFHVRCSSCRSFETCISPASALPLSARSAEGALSHLCRGQYVLHLQVEANVQAGASLQAA